MGGIKAERGDTALFVGGGVGGIAITGSAFVSEAMAASLLSMGAVGLGDATYSYTASSTTL